MVCGQLIIKKFFFFYLYSPNDSHKILIQKCFLRQYVCHVVVDLRNRDFDQTLAKDGLHVLGAFVAPLIHELVNDVVDRHAVQLEFDRTEVFFLLIIDVFEQSVLEEYLAIWKFPLLQDRFGSVLVLYEEVSALLHDRLLVEQFGYKLD